MKDLGLVVGTLDEPLYVSSPLGARVRVDQICQCYKLEILEILLTVGLRVMNMSKFDVILEMNWLATYQVIINCDRKRVTTYTPDGICFKFQGEKYGALPQVVYDSR